MLATTINDHSTTVTGIDEQGDVGDDEGHKSHSKGQETTQARNGTKVGDFEFVGLLEKKNDNLGTRGITQILNGKHLTYTVRIHKNTCRSVRASNRSTDRRIRVRHKRIADQQMAVPSHHGMTRR